MGVIQLIKDWINFRAMVTPVILKLLFQLLFWVLNILGILGLLGLLVMGIIGALGVYSAVNNDITPAIFSLVVTLIMVIVGATMLLLLNLLLRVYFEILLLIFNMYDSLLAIERKLDLKQTEEKKKTTPEQKK